MKHLWVVVALAIACRHSASVSAPATDSPTERYSSIPATHAPIDAAQPDASRDDEAMARQLTSDNPGSKPVQGDDDGAELDADGHVVGNLIHEENGITIVDVPAPVWCAPKTKGHACVGKQSECVKLGPGPCVLAKAFACFTATAATTGEEMPFCYDTYGNCVSRLDRVSNPELLNLTACFVARYKPATSRR